MLNAQRNVKQWEQVIHDGITQVTTFSPLSGKNDIYL